MTGCAYHDLSRKAGFVQGTPHRIVQSSPHLDKERLLILRIGQPYASRACWRSLLWICAVGSRLGCAMNAWWVSP